MAERHPHLPVGRPRPTLARVEVDVRAHGANVEKVFTVAPGADPGRIEVGIQGALALRIDAHGDLVAETGNGPVRFAAPRAFQVVDGERLAVAVRYALRGVASYSFQVGPHDASFATTIDPPLQATYLGGGSADAAEALAIEANGNVIVAGRTASDDFPGTTGGAQPIRAGSKFSFHAFDAFVASLTPDLTTLNQATYLGGGDYDMALGARD